ncbi:MAG: SprT family zinc-dependent metalloprotease [Akkermansiaceae bacterium]|nr:SprT family zinc-dependent metalloprotease [Akkermansiaceae bacterium]
MDLKEAFSLLKEEMGAHGLIDLGWSAKLDDAKKRFGVSRMGPKEISISRPLISLNPEEEVRDTILHEIAHALAWELHKKNCGHDARWQEICVRIGAKPDRCYDDEVIQPELPWSLCHAETGEIFATYQRKPARDPSQMWRRGRKEETYGKMVYCLNPKLYPPGALEGFDRNVAREFQAEVMEAVNTIGAKWGIQTEQVKGSFSERKFDLAMRFIPGEADNRNPEKQAFEEHAGLFGLTAQDYQRPFVSQGKPYRLVALKPRNPKYPVIGVNREEKRFKFPRDVLQNLV